MDYFNYKNQELWVENLPLKKLIADQTPCYVYSQSTIERHLKAFQVAFANRKHQVCYAVKANSHLAILKIIADFGFGFDIVSVGELERVLVAGGDPSKVIFSGVGKQDFEIKRGLEVGIGCFNVESVPELELISKIAQQLNKTANISLRVNPDIDAATHPYISTGLLDNKFGIAIEDAVEIYQYAQTLGGLKITGIDCHIGSQIVQARPYVDSVKRLVIVIKELYDLGIKLEHIDIGGGLGVRYVAETPISPSELMAEIYQELDPLFKEIGEIKVIVEPGRAIIANAGVLVTKVLFIKSNPVKNFAIVDAAMNDLIRPSLYQAYMDIIELEKQQSEGLVYDVVGPVCETGDFLGKERVLAINSGDYLVVRGAGAYSSAMSSNYNTRPKITEFMVKDDQARVISRKQTIAEIYQLESI